MEIPSLGRRAYLNDTDPLHPRPEKENSTGLNKVHIATPQEQAESVKVQLWTAERAFSPLGVKAFSGLESIIGLT